MPSNPYKPILLALLALPLLQMAAFGQSKKDKSRADHDGGTARLRIEVTGGPQKKPVPEASVYVKFAEKRTLLPNKKIELNLKTSQEGVARSPEIPQGRILIQIVAPGWQTFGEWYEIRKSERTIQIHLKRPKRRWY